MKPLVRHDEALARIRSYILDNPLRWATDDENLAVHHEALR